MDLSANDRDALIRTIIGEAGDQPDVGKAAVASVILNRVAKGGFGGSDVTSVVHAPFQFEAWTHADKLNAIDPKSADYQKIGAIVDGVAAGKVADPTGGALNFIDPELQVSMGRSIPSWAAGPGQRIGQHVFFGGTGVAPVKPVSFFEQGGVDTTPKPTGAPPAATAAPAAPAPGAAPKGFFESQGVDVAPKVAPPSGTPGAPARAAAAPAPTAAPANPFANPPAGAPWDRFAKAYADAPAPAAPPTVAAATPNDQGGPAAFVYGANSNIPLIGGPIDTAASYASAFLRSKLTGEDFGSALRHVQEQKDRTRDAHPFAATAGGIVGTGVAGGLALAAAPEAAVAGASRLLGVTGESLPARIGWSTLTGGAIGGADALTRGHTDPGAIATEAAVSAGLGGFGSLAAKPIGAVGSKLFGWVKSPTPDAAAGRSLLSSLETTGKTLPEFKSVLAANPDMAPVDLDPALKARAQGFAATPGEERSIIDKAVQARSAEAAGAVVNAYDDALGKAPDDVLAYVNGLQEQTRANAKAAYTPIMQDAKPVDVSAVIKAIDDSVTPGVNAVVNPGSGIPLGAAKQALVDVKALLTNGTEVLTDANRLNDLQSQLRVQADTLASSANGQDRLTAKAIYDVRNKINDAIDAAAPGFKAAQAKYADDKAVEQGFKDGLTFFQNRTSEAGILQDRPEAWKAYLDDAPQTVKDAIRVGVRTAASQAIGAAKNAALKGETLAMPSLNQEKLAVLLGKDEAASLVKKLSNEYTKAATNAELTRGSQTAIRLAAADANEPYVPGMVPTNTTLSGLAARGLAEIPQKMVINPAFAAFGAAKNQRVASALMDQQKFLDLVEGPARAAARRAEATRLLGLGANAASRGAVVPTTRLFGGP